MQALAGGLLALAVVEWSEVAGVFGGTNESCNFVGMRAEDDGERRSWVIKQVPGTDMDGIIEAFEKVAKNVDKLT